jgi:anti-anti-sigma regulatory factor
MPLAHEAALLYAANHTEAAIALLRAEIRAPAGRSNKQAWLMLFDLYEVTQNRSEFESLSMLFTVRFEQSPPMWAENADAAVDPRRAQSRERKDFFALKPTPAGDLAPEIEKFLAFAEDMGTVRLDVAKVSAMTPEEASLFGAALQHLRKSRLPMWFNHMDSLERVLRATFNEGVSELTRPYWLLLFEVLILQGKMDAFEDLGMEYAVAFEISPPNWEAYVNSISAAAAKSAPAAPAAPEAGFSLKGVLSAASQNQLADLAGYAASHAEVAVDMGKLLRIDFATGSQLFEAVKAIELAGKRVVFTHLSELNAAVLEAFGVNRHATLVRRKST